MRMLAFIVAFFIAAGCSGSGGFNEAFKLGKQSEEKENNDGQDEELGSEKDGDSADQPIQITGTYLTCAEINSSDTHATFGCRLASKTNGTTVNLNDLASQWNFQYELLKKNVGTVTTKQVAAQGTYHVFYDFEAVAKDELKMLIAGTKIILDLVLRPGVGVETSGPEFSGPITSFVPEGQSEVTNGTQSNLDDSIVNSPTEPAPGNEVVQNTGNTGNTGNDNTQPSPTAPSPAPVASGSPNPANPPPSDPSPENPAAGQVPEIPQPANVVANGNDPVATFSLALKSDGVMSFMAAFDQEGLSDATFSVPSSLGYSGSFANGDGSSTFMLTTSMTVSVKKGDKTCTGSGTIGAGKISLPLACK